MIMAAMTRERLRVSRKKSTCRDAVMIPVKATADQPYRRNAAAYSFILILDTRPRAAMNNPDVPMQVRGMPTPVGDWRGMMRVREMLMMARKSPKVCRE